MAAIALAGAVAWFSIRGMVMLFPGSPMYVIGMVVAMELAKLARPDGAPSLRQWPQPLLGRRVKEDIYLSH